MVARVYGTQCLFRGIDKANGTFTGYYPSTRGLACKAELYEGKNIIFTT